jgi:ubiquinone/menaquinone biosynthesis C-methylase UbiE
MLARKTAEERARDDFLIDFKLYLTRELGNHLKTVYDARAKRRFVERHKRAPETRHEVGAVMGEEPLYQMWSALGRIQQELYVDASASCVERQLPQLIDTYRRYAKAPKYGTLKLDPTLEIPAYQSAADIHCVPGGYFEELAADDVFAGARYDIGSFVFGRGKRGPLNDERGRSGVAFLAAKFPDLKPRRILDLGCGSGFNTPPYRDLYPQAEIHGIDLSASCLRYAHARSEALEVPIHFSQQNAERTSFADRSFDLIVSHILFHETSRKAAARIVAECHRLLAPGGLMLHLDVPRHLTCKTPYDKFMADWDTMNNNEPFWGTLLFDIDMVELAVKAGFARESVHEELAAAASQAGFAYWAYYAVKER